MIEDKPWAMFANCEVLYDGRASSTLERGNYLIVYKRDRSVGEAQKFAAAFRTIPPKYTVLHTPVLEVTVDGKPIDIKLKSLFEKVELSLDRTDLADAPVYFGGPVQTERGFVLHERLDDDGGHYNSTLKIPGGGLEMTTSKDVLEALSNGAGPKKIFVTLGYAGWGAGQVEDEISRNGWLTVDAEPSIIFDTPVEARYDRALSLLGIDPGMLMQSAGHA